jgi:hypothetical protein
MRVVLRYNSLAYPFAALLILAAGVFAETDEHAHPHPGPVAGEGRGLTIPQELWDRVDVGFLMELEGFAAKSGDVNESDITLATVELTVGADVVDGISGYLGILWEEDDTEEDNLDEAYLKFGSTESVPFYATAGKMYLPFGNFESVFISDPLTLELAEIRESAGMVGYANGWVDVSVGAFNGDLEEGTDDNIINNGVASIRFTPLETLVFGVYWLSDLLEADGFEGFMEASFPDGHEERAGAGAFATAVIGPVSVNAEYVTAIESIDVSGEGLRPSAYNVEASIPVHEKVAVGIKFEGSDDFYSDYDSVKWADWQTGFVVSYFLNQNVIISGEYLYGDGLVGDESLNMATVQIALVL